jgi:hypothetical protein
LGFLDLGASGVGVMVGVAVGAVVRVTVGVFVGAILVGAGAGLHAAKINNAMSGKPASKRRIRSGMLFLI